MRWGWSRMADKFDAVWRSECRVRVCPVAEVAPFVSAHYLGKKPAIILLCLVMEHQSVPVGCIIYSAPSRETSIRYGGLTWELARLYIVDAVPCNAETWLIAKSIRHIKRTRRDVKFLVSYADPSVGHTGLIYRAANWRCDGRTDQERKSPRCDYVDAKTGKKYGRKGNMPTDAQVERIPRVSKSRFIYPLSEP